MTKYEKGLTEKMKYKIGDKVIVRKDLKQGYYRNDEGRPNGIDSVLEEMLKYAGETLTIVGYNVGDNRRNISYYVEENKWSWVDGMFEGKAEKDKPEGKAKKDKQKEIKTENLKSMFAMEVMVDKVIYSNPATILFYRCKTVDKKTRLTSFSNQRKVISKCNVDCGDVYDEQRGLEVALFKAYQKEINRALAKF